MILNESRLKSTENKASCCFVLFLRKNNVNEVGERFHEGKVF